MERQEFRSATARQHASKVTAASPRGFDTPQRLTRAGKQFIENLSA